MSNNEPWQTEIKIDAELVKKLIEQQFPNLKLQSIEPFGQGWDNKAFLLNHQWLFRLPTRQLAAELMRVEIQLLPILKDQLPLPIPTLEFIGQPSTDYPWPFAGYSVLPGSTACRVQLDNDLRSGTAIKLAGFLKKLHSQELNTLTKTMSLPADTHQKSDPELRIPFTRKHLASLEQRGLIENKNVFDSLLTACANTPIDDPGVLVHGDLYVRHLLLNSQNQLCGIIDWGDAHRGHPAVDLGIVYSFLPKEAHPLFWHEYGAVDDTTRLLAKLRALYSSLMLIDYGDKTKDHDLVREGQWCLSQAIWCHPSW